MCIERPSERARAGMSPEALDGLARAFTRDGYVIVQDVLSPVQLRVLRAECDAVTRCYARLGGPPEPRRRDSSAPPEEKEEAEAEEEEEDAEPSNVSLEWLARDFGCILEVPGCCGCCPAPDPRAGGYRSEACAVTRAAVDATLAPDGPLGALARALLGGSEPSAAFSKDEKEPLGTATDDDVCLFNDQYIVKPPSSAAARFTWHRDSQWCDEAAGSPTSPTLGKRKTEAQTVANVARQSPPRFNAQRVPYVSLWTALDDVDATNGCVRVLPYPAARDGESEIHHEDDASRRLDVLSRNRWREDLSDRERDEAAAAFRDVRVCVMRAGDTLCMSDRVLHCSGPNASGALRRAWMPQFSKRAIRKRDGEPTALAVPARSVGNA